MLRLNKSYKRRTGIGVIEITIGAFLTTVVTAIGVNLTVLTLGFSMLDSAARDAARAAGSQQSLSEALSAAQSQLSLHQTDGVYIQQPVLLGTTAPYFVYQDWAGASPPSPKQSPYVTVTCSENIHLPVNVPFFGIDLNDWTNKGYLTFSRRYTFPLVREKYYGG